MPSCKHYATETAMTPVPTTIPVCMLLRHVKRTDDMGYTIMNDAMAKAGGSALPTTACSFKGELPCPYDAR